MTEEARTALHQLLQQVSIQASSIQKGMDRLEGKFDRLEEKMDQTEHDLLNQLSLCRNHSEGVHDALFHRLGIVKERQDERIGGSKVVKQYSGTTVAIVSALTLTVAAIVAAFIQRGWY